MHVKNNACTLHFKKRSETQCQKLGFEEGLLF